MIDRRLKRQQTRHEVERAAVDEQEENYLPEWAEPLDRATAAPVWVTPESCVNAATVEKVLELIDGGKRYALLVFASGRAGPLDLVVKLSRPKALAVLNKARAEAGLGAIEQGG